MPQEKSDRFLFIIPLSLAGLNDGKNSATMLKTTAHRSTQYILSAIRSDAVFGTLRLFRESAALPELLRTEAVLLSAIFSFSPFCSIISAKNTAAPHRSGSIAVAAFIFCESTGIFSRKPKWVCGGKYKSPLLQKIVYIFMQEQAL